MEIRYLKHSQIDYKKWDACIENSGIGLIYGLSWYLDIVNPGWEAIILGDYKAVMPLPVKNKLGIKYIFQPYYTQQLGVFSEDRVDPKTLSEFLKSIGKNYKILDFNLNYTNPLVENSFDFCERVNYELFLNNSYQQVYNQYSSSNKDTLTRAYKKNKLMIQDNLPVKHLIELYRKTSPVKVNEFQVQILEKIHSKAISEGICKTYGLYNHENNLVAASSFMHFQHRILFFTSVSSEEGKKNRAMFQMLDFIIKENAGKDLILDFEGSNIPSIARFFAGFGPQQKNYYGIKRVPIPSILNKLLTFYRRIR